MLDVDDDKGRCFLDYESLDAGRLDAEPTRRCGIESSTGATDRPEAADGAGAWRRSLDQVDHVGGQT
jgi:hypothetical protein